MNKYKVSVSLYVHPMVVVEAENENAAKDKAYKIMKDQMCAGFDGDIDCWVLDGDGINSNSWEVKKLTTEFDRAIEILKHYGFPLDNVPLLGANVTERKTIDGKKVEYIYLDFNEKLFAGTNYCYLRIDDIPYFLADDSGAYPADINSAKTYVWKRNDDRVYMFDDNFSGTRIGKECKWNEDVTYLRACILNEKFDYEGVVVIHSGSEMIKVRPLKDNENIMYYFYYDNCKSIQPTEGQKVELLSL